MDELTGGPENVSQNVSPPSPVDEQIAAPEADSAEQSTSTSSLAEHSTTPVEIDDALLRLKSYCDENGLKAKIEREPPQDVVSIEIRNGPTNRTVYVSTLEAVDSLLQSPLNEIVFLETYSAICCYREGWIEAAVRSLSPLPARGLVRRMLFGPSSASSEACEVVAQGTAGRRLLLTERRGILYWLDYGAPLYLRIEGLNIAQHDATVQILEDLSNSLFLQIDLRFDTPLVLGRDRGSRLRRTRQQSRSAEDNQIAFPRFLYQKNPSLLYWYARSATSMPLLQFLAFYQCIEFFFPQYTKKETIERIRNVLKHPTFDCEKDNDVNTVLNVTIEGHRGPFAEERKQLRVTLQQCVEAADLRDFYGADELRKSFYQHDFKTTSKVRVDLSENSDVVNQTAERIYDLRCKVVHTKNLDAGTGDEMLLPFSKESESLAYDVELVQFLARKVLVASSVSLSN